MNKIAIIHFQPIEKYPPILNFINSIIKEKNISCKIYTTNNNDDSWFSAKKCQISRIGKPTLNPFLRYWGYCQFNLITFLKLLFTKPKIIIAYETYSLLPVYFYKKLFNKTKLFIHYHEYTSPSEIKNSSKYYKCIHFFEKKLFVTCNFISQTNSDRLELFLTNYPLINKSKTFTAPNLPPSSWYEFAKSNRKKNRSGVIRLVHVGAIGLNSMYIKETIEWVLAQNGKYCIDFYSSNITEDAKKLFENVQNKYVKLMEQINYFEIPEILNKYDIGLTLYKGCIPNHIYSVPNKVFEYLACGLNVWYSKELISTNKFVKQYDIKGCKKIDFLNIKINQETALNEFNENSFFANTTNTFKDKVFFEIKNK